MRIVTKIVHIHVKHTHDVQLIRITRTHTSHIYKQTHTQHTQNIIILTSNKLLTAEGFGGV